MSEITKLYVHYNDKEEAKKLGARWNKDDKSWYLPAGVDTKPFEKWLKEQDKKERLGMFPKDQRKTLIVDLIPTTGWFSNLRSELSPAEWEQVKTKTFKQANYRCELCGAQGPQHPVECHERWTYNDETGMQVLQRTIALCPDCHTATHFGLAQVRGKDKEAFKQLMTVNGWDEERTNNHIRKAFGDWKKRCGREWTLDARWLLYFIDVSDATKDKIEKHATGQISREITSEQKEIVDKTSDILDELEGL